jgi:hypothetical protein
MNWMRLLGLCPRASCAGRWGDTSYPTRHPRRVSAPSPGGGLYRGLPLQNLLPRSQGRSCPRDGALGLMNWSIAIARDDHQRIRNRVGRRCHRCVLTSGPAPIDRP